MNISILVNDRACESATVETLEEFTKATESVLFKEIMEQEGYSQLKAAKDLKMNRGTFRKKLKSYGLLK